MENQISGIAEEFLSLQERSRLVGICSKLIGNPDVAEDLTQETLFLVAILFCPYVQVFTCLIVRWHLHAHSARIEK